MKQSLPSRRFVINVAVWLALSLFYEVYSLLSKTQIVSTLQVALRNAHIYIATNLTLWCVWCGLVSTAVVVHVSAETSVRRQWLFDLALITICTVVVLAVFGVIITSFLSPNGDQEAKMFVISIADTVLFYGLATNLFIACVLLGLANASSRRTSA
jgi:glucan phosphoethanolaminetransferase (alkaline phosphatase superfamily)